MTHHLLEFLRGVLVQYGYWALAIALLLENAGIPLPGETILLLASFLAYSEHDLSLPWIIVISTIAATLGDNLGFALGFYGGRPLLERYQKIFRIKRETLERGENLFARFGAPTVLLARFIFGMRIIAGPMAGMLRMPWKKFAVLNFFGAATWVTAISGAGYFFGRHWGRLERDLERFDIAIAVLALLAIIYWWWRSRNQNGTRHLRS